MIKDQIAAGIVWVAVFVLNGTAFPEETATLTTPSESAKGGSAWEGQVDLGNVVISETKSPVADLPASVTIVGGKEHERIPYKKGIDVIRAVPNLLVTDYNQGGVPAEYVLRGFSGGHSNVSPVFLDGAPLNESNSHADWIADFNMLITAE